MVLSISLANWWFSEINLVPVWEEKSLDFFSENVLTNEVNPCWYASYWEILWTANALSHNTPLETVLTVLCTYYKPNNVKIKVLFSSLWYMHLVSPVSLNFCIHLFIFYKWSTSTVPMAENTGCRRWISGMNFHWANKNFLIIALIFIFSEQNHAQRSVDY